MKLGKKCPRNKKRGFGQRDRNCRTCEGNIEIRTPKFLGESTRLQDTMEVKWFHIRSQRRNWNQSLQLLTKKAKHQPFHFQSKNRNSYKNATEKFLQLKILALLWSQTYKFVYQCSSCLFSHPLAVTVREAHTTLLVRPLSVLPQFEFSSPPFFLRCTRKPQLWQHSNHKPNERGEE